MFAEHVLYLPVATTEQKKNKLAPKWEDAIFLGMKDSSNEYLVGTEEGVFRAAQVKRVPESERFEQARLKSMVGTPWQREPKESSDFNIALPAVVTIPVSTDDTVPDVSIPEPIPRRMYIKPRDLEKYGYTKGCPRCEPLREGRSTTAEHSDDCRKRITDAMEADKSEDVQTRVKKTVTGRNEYIEKRVAEDGQQAKKAKIQSSSQAKPNQPSASVPGADETKKRLVDQSQSQANPSTSASSSSAAPAAAAPAVSAKRQLEPSSVSEDDEDMLSIRNLIKESAEADIDSLCQELKMLGLFSVKRNDVSEIYSRPRVTAYAARLGLSPGFALDLAVVDPDDGMPWDFDNPNKCAKAKRKVQLKKPKLLIGSPMCTAFSQLQALSKDKGNIEKKKLLLVRVIKHIRLCVSLYWEQIKNGRYFLHEHPASANSWKLPEIIQLLTYPGVVKVVGHMCAYGMKSTDEKGEGLVKKPTGWMTNSPYIAEQVSALCSNRWKGQMHRHVHLISGRAKAAEVYPPKLCKAILTGLRYQFIADGLMVPGEIGTVCCEEPIITDDVKEEVRGQIQRSYYDSADGSTYYDDITGELLDMKQFKKRWTPTRATVSTAKSQLQNVLTRQVRNP